MKSYRLVSLVLAAVALCVGAIAVCCWPVVEMLYATAGAVKRIVLGGLALAAGATADKVRTQLPFVQARAFVGRLVRRERVQLSSGWRHCPST
ncbi:MAG: hypothetical protein JWQ72_1680 [Polaromonas sp.]|nr:hypothetical protein [Polaromonas sp.]